MPENAEKIVKDYKRLLGERSTFESLWQTVHDYAYIEAEPINTTSTPGTELDFSHLYDTTSINSADILASGIANTLTPPTGKWFALKTIDQKLMANTGVSTFLQEVSEEVYYTLNRSNFYSQNTTFYKGSGVYGTAVMLSEKDPVDLIRFYDMPIRQCCLVDDARGRVQEYYLQYNYTAYQAVTRFGEEKVSEKIRKAYRLGHSNDKYEFCLHIAPRHERDPSKDDAVNMPFKAVWVDVDDKKIMKESGFESSPCVTHRFYTRSGSPYGYSPTMKALPNFRWLNAMAKTQMRVAMKQSDPPIALPNKAFLLPPNMNPSALNYYNANKMSKDAIFEFGNAGNFQINELMMQKKEQDIRDAMFTDVFLAFQNITKQMTVPEVMQKVSEKMTLLGPAVQRYMGDFLAPIIQRTIAVLAEAKKLPKKIPDKLMKNPAYEIEFTSALALAQKSSDINSMSTALTFVQSLQPYYPEVLDKINPDEIVNEVWGITGAHAKALRGDKEVQEIRMSRAMEMQALAEKQEIAENVGIAQAGSEIAKNLNSGAQGSA